MNEYIMVNNIRNKEYALEYITDKIPYILNIFMKKLLKIIISISNEI